MNVQTTPVKFVGRDNYLKLLKECLDTRTYPNDTKALHFFGVGGVGKSTLNAEFRKILREKKQNYAVIDFKDNRFHDLKETLFFLRNNLKQSNQKVSFVLFDLAYAIYTKKANPYTPFESNKNLAYLEETDYIANFIKDVWEVMEAGWIPKAMDFFLNYSHKAAKWWKKRGNEVLKQLVALDYDQIESYLVHFWAEDVRNFVTNSDQSIIILLDTLEKLTKTSDNSFDYHDTYWIEDLIHAAPEVFWVSFGRDSVSWIPEMNQKPLDKLADGEIVEYLKHHQIFDLSIQNTIVSTSKGHPYYLYLCVATYYKLKDQKTPTTEDFEGDYEKVVKRFLAHLTPREIYTLKILSIPNFWDQEVFDYLVTNGSNGLEMVLHQDICSYSFISNTEDGSFEMHELMRESLRETLLKDNLKLYGMTHQLLFDYYDGVLPEEDLYHVSPAHKKAILEAIYHGFNSQSVTDFSARFLQIINPLVIQPENFSFIKSLLYSILESLELTNPAHRVTKFHILFLLITGFNSTHQLKDSEKLVNENEELLLSLKDDVPPAFYSEMQYKHFNVKGGLDYIRGHYNAAETHLLKAIECHEKEDQAELINTLVDLADVYRLNNKPDKAREIYNQFLEDSGEDPWYDFMSKYRWAQVLRRAALVFEKEDPAKAMKMSQEAYDLLVDTVGEKHPNTLHVLFHIADLTTPEANSIKKHREVLELRKQYLGEEDASVAQSCYTLGRLLIERNSIEARKLLELSISIGVSVYGDYDEVIAQSYRALGLLDRHKKHYKRSLNYFLKSYEIYEAIKNQINEDKMYGIHFEVGSAYYYLEQYQAAIASLTEAHSIAERFFGPESNECRLALENIGYCFQGDDKLREALPFFLQAHEIESAMDQNTLGPVIGEIYNKLGEFPNAERYLKSMLDYTLSHQGETYLGTALAYHNYGAVLARQGKYPQAEKYYRKSIASIEAHELIGKDNRFYDAVKAILNSMYSHFSSMPKSKSNKAVLEKIGQLIHHHFNL